MRSKADWIKHIGLARMRTVEGYTLETYKAEYRGLQKMRHADLKALAGKEIAKAREAGHLKPGH